VNRKRGSRLATFQPKDKKTSIAEATAPGFDRAMLHTAYGIREIQQVLAVAPDFCIMEASDVSQAFLSGLGRGPENPLVPVLIAAKAKARRAEMESVRRACDS
jgi:hypothetical protein